MVDALVSGTSVSNNVQVRVLFWAPGKKENGEMAELVDALLWGGSDNCVVGVRVSFSSLLKTQEQQSFWVNDKEIHKPILCKTKTDLWLRQ